MKCVLKFILKDDMLSIPLVMDSKYLYLRYFL